MIVHNVTRITTELLHVDETGNVVDRKQIQQDIQRLSVDEFEKAHQQISDFIQQWSNECQAQSE